MLLLWKFNRSFICCLCFCMRFGLNIIHSVAHHRADAMQVTKGEYDRFKRDKTNLRRSDKRRVVLAAAALASAAAEPSSDYEGLATCSRELPRTVATCSRELPRLLRGPRALSQLVVRA
jgi:hypothetical protein